MRAEEAALRASCFDPQELEQPLAGPPPERLYVTMDGAKAHIDGAWHDVKCGAIYPGRLQEVRVVTPNGTDKSVRRNRSEPKRYLARQGEAATFGERL